MSEASRGLPLLSGLPPSDSNNAEIACRKCSKEFNVIFNRSRRCNHCGYAYCNNCTDYQALMPRTSAETGYDAMNVCGFCIEYLTITAAGRTQLKSMPMSKLRNYINAYNISTERVVEKDDLIDALLKARGQNGCLSAAHEAYYRQYSVPNKIHLNRSRGIFSSNRRGQSSTTSETPPPPRQTRPDFARPDLAADNPPPPQNRSYPYAPRPRPAQPTPSSQQQQSSPPRPPPRPPFYPSQPTQQQQQYAPPPGPPPRPRSAYGYAPPHHAPPPFHTPPPPPPPHSHGYAFPGYNTPEYSSEPPPVPQRPQQPAPSPPPRPRATSTVPPPSLDQLLTMPPESIRSLSIGHLKNILFTNHVNAGTILEKGDLVSKVLTLVADERKERERQRQMEEMEEMERVQREIEAMEERVRRERMDGATDSSDQFGRHSQFDGRSSPHVGGLDEGDDQETSVEDQTVESVQRTTSAPPLPKQPKVTVSSMERNGLCVICQDEEANIAIVDCGHLAMCRTCSDLVMSSSRECPLCRTRIVTEARLLRIFKT